MKRERKRERAKKKWKIQIIIANDSIDKKINIISILLAFDFLSHTERSAYSSRLEIQNTILYVYVFFQ